MHCSKAVAKLSLRAMPCVAAGAAHTIATGANDAR